VQKALLVGFSTAVYAFLQTLFAPYSGAPHFEMVVRIAFPLVDIDKAAFEDALHDTAQKVGLDVETSVVS